MLYITDIGTLRGLTDKDAEKLKIGTKDTLVFVEESADQSLPLKDVVWLLSHVQSRDTRIITNNAPSALVALGALMARSAQTTIIGKPFGAVQDEGFFEALKGHRITFFGEKKAPQKPKEPAASAPQKEPEPKKGPPKPPAKGAPQKAEPPKAPKPIEKKPAPKPTGKGLFARFGIPTSELSAEDEKAYGAIIEKAEDFTTYRKEVLSRFGIRAGAIMMQTSEKSIEELKEALKGDGA